MNTLLFLISFAIFILIVQMIASTIYAIFSIKVWHSKKKFKELWLEYMKTMFSSND